MSFNEPPTCLIQLHAAADQLGGFLHLTDRFLGFLLYAGNQLGNFLRGLGRTLGELPDLFGHHGEAHALFAGAGGLDGRVQGEEIGLLGDVVDHVHDLADVLGP